MQYISRLLLVLSFMLVAQATVAQPPARQRENAKKVKKSESPSAAFTGLSERAKSQYPGTVTPQEVEWKRDVYRVLDLEKEKNASLYYPVEPMGGNMNLFTFLFRNIINGNITAYEYSLDGYESFTEENAVDPKLILDDYRIMYEEQDGEIVVNKSDVPSAEVLSYYVKESHYYDQRSGTYGKQITAVCPVLHRSGEYSSEVTKYPMFWLKYEDIATYLAQQSIMTSSLNNASSMTIDDFFKKGCYKGEIYKTVNTKNLAIAQYCKDSVSVKREQEKIEQELEDFKKNLWNTKTAAELRKDSVNAVKEAETDSVANNTAKKKADSKTVKEKREVKEKKTTVKQPKEPKAKPARNTNSGTVSVRRVRR